jgi:hypothetical protein
MEGLREFLADLKRHGFAQGNFLGLLNVLIGRRVQKADGELISNGLTWRTLADLLTKVRWDKEAVRDLGIEPRSLPPRDRTRYWFQCMAQARLDSQEAMQAGDRLAEKLSKAGYAVGPAPGSRPEEIKRNG